MSRKPSGRKRVAPVVFRPAVCALAFALFLSVRPSALCEEKPKPAAADDILPVHSGGVKALYILMRVTPFDREGLPPGRHCQGGESGPADIVGDLRH